MLKPIYENPAPSPQPDIFNVVREFVLTYGLPALLPDDIIRSGSENNNPLPANTDKAVISLLETSRCGSNVEKILNTALTEDEPETYEVRAYYTVKVRIDFHADSDLGRQRAAGLETLCRSGLGAFFFKPYGLSLLYAEPIEDTTLSDEAGLINARRHSLDLYLAYWSGLDVKSAWVAVGFDDPGLTINRARGFSFNSPLKEN